MPDSHPAVVTPLLEATELEELLIYLYQVHQVDLTGYKRSTLMRRTRVRMQQVGVGQYQDYLTHLQQHRDEVTQLLNTIYINHTDFFRDRSVWDYLANQAIPQIIANKAPHQPIRIWSAGCATGEETYSLVMLLMSALGVEQFQRRVQIYGTDVDADAILQACQGRYSADRVKPVPPDLKAQYFERQEDCYCWRQEFCQPIHFQLHNLIQDLPLPHIDLLVCRNLLMYFTVETQLQILASFYFSLEDQGWLLLGKVENLIIRLQLSLFKPIHRSNRMFIKVPEAYQNSSLRSCLWSPAAAAKFSAGLSGF